MFYAHFVLSKKGPLAKIWLAAHWDKKLTKAHVFETNIESSVEGILQPKVKMALRTSGHLLLGIVRIYSRKAKYLLADCNEAFIKIKMAFRPGIVDLPEGNREAAVATITLPEVFHDFDTAMPDITIDMDAQVSLNQSRAEDITLKEDYGTLSLMADDGFEDMPFEPETGRDGTSMEDGFDHATLLLGEELQKEQQSDETLQSTSTAETSLISKPNISLDAPLKDDGFGGTVGEGLLDGESGALFEPAGLFDDAPLGEVPLQNTEQPPEPLEPAPEPEKQPEKPPEPVVNDESSDDDMYDMAPGSIGAPSPPSSPETPPPPASEADIPPPLGIPTSEPDIPSEPLAPPETPTDILAPPETPQPPPPPPPSVPPVLDHTTLINNEDESFALAPLDTTIMHGPERSVKAKRKRKLIVDEVKNISGEEMKSQLSDTTDIVTTLDLAPPTKRLMQWKETGGVEKLFALPGHRILSKTLSRAYQRHLTTRSAENEDFDIEDRIDLDAELEQAREDPEATGLNSRKKPRRDNFEHPFPQDLPIDSLHLDNSRPSYASEHHLTHPSLDMQSYLQPPHPLFPPPPDQIMANVLPPPAHMMLPDNLSQLPDMMHPSMADQGPPLHSITPTIQNDTSAVAPEVYNQHFPSDGLPDPMQPPSMDKQMLDNDQMNQQNHIDNLSVIQNNLHPTDETEIMHPNMDHTLHPPVDEDATQPCTIGDYNQPLNADALPPSMLNELPNHDPNLLIVNNHVNETSPQNPSIPNEAQQQAMSQQQSEFNALFDSLHNGDIQPQNNLQVQEDQPNDVDANDVDANNVDANQKTNDLPVSDDDDDYAAPGSVGPVMPEEQMADETYEQFEERILSKRTTHMLHIINSKLDQDKSVSFAWLLRNNKRKQVAQKFYTFLVLKKLQAIELEQSSSYGVLIITKGPKFDAVYNSN